MLYVVSFAGEFKTLLIRLVKDKISKTALKVRGSAKKSVAAQSSFLWA